MSRQAEQVAAAPGKRGRRWTFFSNHFHVLLVVARHPDARLRAVADEVGITERAAHRILTDLAHEGYLTVTKEGRRNHYRLNPGMRLRHEANKEVPLDPLVSFINENARDLHPEIAFTSE
jgi:DNA-binding IclR family transcriptional regulator